MLDMGKGGLNANCCFYQADFRRLLDSGSSAAQAKFHLGSLKSPGSREAASACGRYVEFGNH